jgi:hypothetical protein
LQHILGNMSDFDLYMRRAAVRDKFFNLRIRLEFYLKSVKQFLAFLNTPDDEKWATPLPPGVTVRQLYDAADDATAQLQAEVAELEEQRVAARTASLNVPFDEQAAWIDKREIYYESSEALFNRRLLLHCRLKAMLCREGHDEDFYMTQLNNEFEQYVAVWEPETGAAN